MEKEIWELNKKEKFKVRKDSKTIFYRGLDVDGGVLGYVQNETDFNGTTIVVNNYKWFPKNTIVYVI